MKQTRTLDDYLALPYTIELVRDEDDEGNAGYVAEVEELPALPEPRRDARRSDPEHFRCDGGLALGRPQDGKAIPEPRVGKNYSGRFLLRIPQTLHAELAREAEREGVSLKQYAATTLARAVGRVETAAVRAQS
jgi:antitoxin HicB